MPDIAFPTPPVPAYSRPALFRRWGLRGADTPVWRMSGEALRARFCYSTGRFVLRYMIRTALCQLHDAITAGREPGIGGNVRTLWYRYLKPAVGRIDSRPSYDATTNAFNHMVFDLRLFDYADFDLTDVHWESRRIGPRRPEIIVMAEKLSQVRFLREVHTLHGVTTVAGPGGTSGVTAENTARWAWDAMHSTGRPTAPFHVIGLVDYDPEGHSKAAELHRSLLQLGFTAHLHLPIHPRELTQKQLGLRKLPIIRTGRAPKGHLRNWLDHTGGISGEPYCLRIESLPREKRHEVLAKLLTDL